MNLKSSKQETMVDDITKIKYIFAFEVEKKSYLD